MDGNNSLALIVAYYLSRFDTEGLNNLGYQYFTEAFKVISSKLNVKENTIKNMRDEFDPHFDNSRVGWYQRASRPSRQAVIDKFKSLSEPEMRKVVTAVLEHKVPADVEEFIKNVVRKDDDMLQDLETLSNETQSRYMKNYTSEETQLSDEFRRSFGAYLRENSQDVDFKDNTTIIKTGGNLKIFAPNQWFFIAAYMADLIIELKKYKDHLIKILSEKYQNTGERNTFIRNVKNKTGSQDQDVIVLRELAVKYFKALNLNESEIDKYTEYIIRFATDYGWWYGNKTIDRNDFYVSPVLHLAKLLQETQAYVATIANHYAENESLFALASDMFDDNKSTKEAVSKTGTAGIPRKTGGKNLIVYGAPGTGKSRKLEDMFSGSVPPHRVVFHPEYNYYDFVGAYKPVPVYRQTEDVLVNPDGSEAAYGEVHIDYRFVPGPFTTVFVKAWLDPGNMRTLLIEEINRANAAAVFGEIFQLLDRTSEGNSEYTYMPAQELSDYLHGIKGMSGFVENGLSLPSNMNIVATMNSADQGVSIIDAAFKRRWQVKYMSIDINTAVHKDVVIKYAGGGVKWGHFVSAINDKLISLGIDEDKHIGPYFIKPDELDNNTAIDKLLLYLWDDVLRHRRSDFFTDNLRGFYDLSNKFNSADVLFLEDLIVAHTVSDMDISEDDAEAMITEGADEDIAD